MSLKILKTLVPVFILSLLITSYAFAQADPNFSFACGDNEFLLSYSIENGAECAPIPFASIQNCPTGEFVTGRNNKLICSGGREIYTLPTITTPTAPSTGLNIACPQGQYPRQYQLTPQTQTCESIPNLSVPTCADNQYLTKHNNNLECRELPQQVVHGQCSETTNNICVKGTYVDKEDTSTAFLWSCNGINGGRTYNCQISHGRCKNNVKNTCLRGPFRDVPDTTTHYKWQCVGQTGGIQADCEQLKPASINACNPTYVGKITNGTEGALLVAPELLFVKGNYAYVIDSNSKALEIVNISTPSSPTHTGKILLSSRASHQGPSGIFVQGNYAYITINSRFYNSGAIDVIDISDPTTPTNTATIRFNAPRSIFVQGKYAYIITNINQFLVMDISDKSNIREVGSISLGAYRYYEPVSLFVENNYAYVVSHYSNVLRVLNISSPTSPTIVGSITNAQGEAVINVPQSVFVKGDYAYIASAGLWPTFSGALEIVNIIRKTIPTHAGKITNGTGGAVLNYANSVFVEGDFAYIASTNSDALEVVNISNPSSPTHKAKVVDGIGGVALNDPHSVFVQGNYAYVTATGSQALTVIDISTCR